MRSIPIALRERLLERFRAESTQSEPHIRLVATQTSVNTLLSEPIHTDAPPALGDVTIRQSAGQASPSCAYAICLDSGIATIYERPFPVSMDKLWQKLWVYGKAEDVAIEYDGTWRVDPNYQWYFLETEDFPYIFTVESKNLYVQKWKDSSTRELLAENVSQISACKGWKNSIDISLDQGLVIGYLRGGEVFYRAKCTQDDGRVLWEAEQKVEILGSGNTTLAVFRTNDFRLGFLTENQGNIRVALSYRNYAGMSVRPETLHVDVRPRFLHLETQRLKGYARKEHLQMAITHPYFQMELPTPSPEISVLSTARMNSDEDFSSYGCRVVLDKPLLGSIPPGFLGGCKVFSIRDSVKTDVPINRVELDTEANAFVLYFDSPVRRTLDLEVSLPSSRALFYAGYQGQYWFLPTLTCTFPAESRNYYGLHFETLQLSTLAGLLDQLVTRYASFSEETLSVSVTPTVVLEPVASLPI